MMQFSNNQTVCFVLLTKLHESNQYENYHLRYFRHLRSGQNFTQRTHGKAA